MSEAGPPESGPAVPGPTASRWRRVRRRAVRIGLVVGLLALVLALVHRPLLVGYARLFRVHDPAPSDALVLLGVGDPRATAELYRRGLAPVLLLATADPIPFPDLNPAIIDRELLIRGGIPAGAIRLLPSAGREMEYGAVARRVREYARAHPMRRVTVVAGAPHTRRARRCFRRVLRRSGVEVRAAATPNPIFDESNWYLRDEGLVDYFNETIEWIRVLAAP